MMSERNGTHPASWIVDLALAISGATMLPGETRSYYDQKCFIDAAFEVMTEPPWRTMSAARLQQIGDRGLRKLRHPAKIRKLRE